MIINKRKISPSSFIKTAGLTSISIYFFFPQHNIDPVQPSLVIKLTKKFATKAIGHN